MTDYGPPPRVYASWPVRVGGYLLDSVFTAVFALPGYLLVLLGDTTTTTTTDPDHFSEATINADGSWTPIPYETTTTHHDTTTIVGFVLIVVGAVAFFIWNDCVRQGRTGYTYGKQLVGIRLVGDHTGQPIGGSRSFVRQVAHVLDTATCYLGWAWPIWDRKCQTFADKVMETVVVVQR